MLNLRCIFRSFDFVLWVHFTLVCNNDTVLLLSMYLLVRFPAPPPWGRRRCRREIFEFLLQEEDFRSAEMVRGPSAHGAQAGAGMDEGMQEQCKNGERGIFHRYTGHLQEGSGIGGGRGQRGCGNSVSIDIYISIYRIHKIEVSVCLSVCSDLASNYWMDSNRIWHEPPPPGICG